MKRIVIIGAGVGGLTTAAMLARAGLDVTVLEQHISPGGCASTFFHQGYRFDAGATLSAGFDDNGIMTNVGALLGIDWHVEPTTVAMVVHLSDGTPVTRWTNQQTWEDERRKHFGAPAESFWSWQERTADMLWNAAKQGIPWLPQTAHELVSLFAIGARMAMQSPTPMPMLAADMFRSVGSHLTNNANLRMFIDAQLLISAQTTTPYANALYGAAALDLPRRGVAHVHGGMGRIAELLADAVRRNGGQVLFRHKASRVVMRNQKMVAIETNDGKQIFADAVIFNLPPHDAAKILGDSAPMSLRHAAVPDDGWGAFILYLGLDNRIVPQNFPLHHQVIVREPMSEGNTAFLSSSSVNDASRAPSGKRALTISTHTRLKPWWQMYEKDRAAYDARKEEYTQRLLNAAEIVLPNLHAHMDWVMPGTPITFQRFTHRSLGWVGGFPQTNLFRVCNPRIAETMWLVGDSIFPGQSVPAVTLGGMRVANAVLHHVAHTTQKYISLASKEYAHG